MPRTRMPAMYIPHGGGPCFFMDWTIGPADTWLKMADWLRQLSSTLPAKPTALIVFSAHWEAQKVTILSSANPPLLYDYSGFPAHTYTLKYGAPGSPELADRAAKLLATNGIDTERDSTRGFDHGVFIPLKLFFPDAEIPIVQISLKVGLDPLEHLLIGKSLAPLRDEGVLIIGSGMSFHNLGAFFKSNSAGAELSKQFDDWLFDTITETKDRNDKLAKWSNAPSAKFAHPREEHLIPLMVVAGACENDAAVRVFNDKVFDSFVSGFTFG